MNLTNKKQGLYSLNNLWPTSPGAINTTPRRGDRVNVQYWYSSSTDQDPEMDEANFQTWHDKVSPWSHLQFGRINAGASRDQYQSKAMLLFLKRFCPIIRIL